LGAASLQQEDVSQQLLMQKLSNDLAHQSTLQKIQQLQALSSGLGSDHVNLQSLMTTKSEESTDLKKQLLMNQLLTSSSQTQSNDVLLALQQQKQAAAAVGSAGLAASLLSAGAVEERENELTRSLLVNQEASRQKMLMQMLGNGATHGSAGSKIPLQEAQHQPLFNIGRTEPERERNLEATRPKILAKKKAKRPLSAYNIFFKEEHAKIIAENAIETEERAEEEECREDFCEGRDDCEAGEKRKRRDTTDEPSAKRGKRQLDFENLTKIIGKRWKELPPERVQHYKDRAGEAMQKHRNKLFRKIRHSVNAGRQ